MSYGTILAKLRKKNGYTQPEVADYISKRSGKSCSNKSVSHWESGYNMPSVEQFLLMCELYEVRDIQKTFRGIDNDFPAYIRLNTLGKSRVDEYISLLAGNPEYSNYQDSTPSESNGFAVSEPRRGYYRLYDIPTAAGTGNYLDSDSYEEIEIDKTVPVNTDFAVKISGDSMMPRFVDRQTVFIKKQDTLEIGDIGIFTLNGNSVIKKLGHRELISLNPMYEPIPVSEYDSFHVFGKVIGG